MDKIMAIVNIVTNLLAYIVKNVNGLAGGIKAILKIVAGIINIVQPGKDDLVDKIEDIGEKVQEALFKLTDFLAGFGK